MSDKGGESDVMGPARFSAYMWDMVYCDSKGDYVRASECQAVAYGKQSGNGEFQPKRCVGCRGAYTFETLD